jgi:hypothetical protein
MKPWTPLLFSCLAMHALTAHAQTVDVCPTVFEKAELEKEAIAGEQAARKVVGEGRLYFHSAPDKQCQLRYVFVLPNDRLEAYAEHGEFTEVIYWNSKSHAGTAGWVASARIAETEPGTAPGAAHAVMSSNSLR